MEDTQFCIWLSFQKLALFLGLEMGQKRHIKICQYGIGTWNLPFRGLVVEIKFLVFMSLIQRQIWLAVVKLFKFSIYNCFLGTESTLKESPRV